MLSYLWYVVTELVFLLLHWSPLEKLNFIQTPSILFVCTCTGGITTLAIDKDALDEYSRVTESIGNLDEFMARMTRDDIIPSDVRLRCDVEVTHVRNSTQVGKVFSKIMPIFITVLCSLI